MADAPRSPDLKPAPPLPAWRRVAGELGLAAESAKEGLERAGTGGIMDVPYLGHVARALGPFLPYFLLNLENVPGALRRLETHGMRERYSTPQEIEQGEPTLRTPAADLAQVMFAAQGVQPTAQLARGAARGAGKLSAAAVERALTGPGPVAGQAGAVKLPGGSFDWPTFKSLKDALRAGDYSSETENWIDRAVKAYVQKHLGTAQDPLKDLPVGGYGTWEGMTDKAIAPVEARFSEEARRISPSPSVFERPHEPLWGLGREHVPGQSGLPPDYPFALNPSYGDARDAAQALRSEAFRTGEYMQGHVPPAKFQQYDLPRAVLETRKHETALREDARRQVESRLADFPPVREYPDTGLKWVEMTLPRELTPEQAKTVRRMSPGELYDADYPKGPHATWVALDHKGKPIIGKETQEPALGTTREEAWLAGRLEQEGNILGNCVGRYCEDVMSGGSRLYSLRDAKGDSHAVVQVQRPSPIGPASTMEEIEDMLPPGADFRVLERMYRQHASEADARGLTMGSWLLEYQPDLVKKYFGTPREKIVQVEGKGHDLPAERYQGYVDDLEESLKLQPHWRDIVKD